MSANFDDLRHSELTELAGEAQVTFLLIFALGFAVAAAAVLVLLFYQ